MSLIIKDKCNLDFFPERLKVAMEGETLRTFAEKTGLSKTVLHGYMNNKSYPSLDRLTAIAEASNTPVEWFINGEIPDKSTLTVYQYDFKASAGAGALVVSDSPIGEFKLSKEWLIRQGIRETDLCIVEVQGDSMEPTLEEGDLMLVALNDDRAVFKDGINVICVNGDIYVKRLQRDFFNDCIEVKSDNKEYKTNVITAEFKGQFEVIGRLLRVLQRARG